MAEQADNWQPLTEEPAVCDQNPATDPASTVSLIPFLIKPSFVLSGNAALALPMELEVKLRRASRAQDPHRSVLPMPKEPGRTGRLLHADQTPGSGVEERGVRDGEHDVSSFALSLNKFVFRYTYERSVQWITVGCHSVLPRSQRALPIFKHYQRNDLIAT
jgi:hypothetical protein